MSMSIGPVMRHVVTNSLHTFHLALVAKNGEFILSK